MSTAAALVFPVGLSEFIYEEMLSLLLDEETEEKIFTPRSSEFFTKLSS